MPTRAKTHSQLLREKNGRPKDTRPSRHERGYDSKWDKARLHFLAHHPLCAQCEREGRTTAATVVDHVIPHKGDMVLFWDSGNWQSLCARHHNIKTSNEGAFGREVKR